MAASLTNERFRFPKAYRYPPLWSLQPTISTREAQFKHWSQLIILYCQHYRIWRLTLIDALDTQLFHNIKLRKQMSLTEIQQIIDWMTKEDGAQRAEWVGRDGQKATAWIYWKRPEEWAEAILKWAEDSGQKNTVLTLYELTSGEATASQDFYGMDSELLQKTIQVLVKRGKAQLFGSDNQQGVKLF